MDKLVAFFKNVWLKRGVALLCWGYTALVAWVAWLSFGYCFEFENATALFVLYLFVNIAAFGLMIYTRKQVITMVNCMILPPIVFVIVIFGFGNWYMILPPLVVVIAMFFINASNETLKTVLGTIYLLIYVIGVVAYIAINLFMGDITFLTGVNVDLRDYDYEKVSPSGEYRIVRYVDKPGERRTAAYYVETTADDVEIPFGYCKKVFGSKHVHTSSFTSREDDPVSWEETFINGEKQECLSVEGSIRENPYLIVELSETAEE
ncbi:MAG: hypothetical protein ACI4Q4_07835 [Oscillospiraceae bacterium]